MREKGRDSRKQQPARAKAHFFRVFFFFRLSVLDSLSVCFLPSVPLLFCPRFLRESLGETYHRSLLSQKQERQRKGQKKPKRRTTKKAKPPSSKKEKGKLQCLLLFLPPTPTPSALRPRPEPSLRGCTHRTGLPPPPWRVGEEREKEKEEAEEEEEAPPTDVHLKMEEKKLDLALDLLTSLLKKKQPERQAPARGLPRSCCRRRRRRRRPPRQRR